MTYRTAGGEFLWAMDISERPPYRGHPVGAHLIVAVRQERHRGEVRTSACGQEFTAGTHARGWWSTRPGGLPLQEHAVHCGAREALRPAPVADGGDEQGPGGDGNQGTQQHGSTPGKAADCRILQA